MRFDDNHVPGTTREARHGASEPALGAHRGIDLFFSAAARPWVVHEHIGSGPPRLTPQVMFAELSALEQSGLSSVDLTLDSDADLAGEKRLVAYCLYFARRVLAAGPGISPRLSSTGCLRCARTSVG